MGSRGFRGAVLIRANVLTGWFTNQENRLCSLQRPNPDRRRKMTRRFYDWSTLRQSMAHSRAGELTIRSSRSTAGRMKRSHRSRTRHPMLCHTLTASGLPSEVGNDHLPIHNKSSMDAVLGQGCPIQNTFQKNARMHFLGMEAHFLAITFPLSEPHASLFF